MEGERKCFSPCKKLLMAPEQWIIAEVCKNLTQDYGVGRDVPSDWKKKRGQI